MFMYTNPIRMSIDDLPIIGLIISQSDEGLILETHGSYIAFRKQGDLYESVARELKSTHRPVDTLQTLHDMINLYMIL